MKNKFLSFASLLFICLFFGQTINAQSNVEETDIIQSIFGMGKKAVVTEFIAVDSDNPFWKLYDEYETERKALGKQRLLVLTDYVSNYDNLTTKQYDGVVADMMSIRNKTDKLMDQYYRKIKRASGSKVAAQFFQLEGYFLTQIRAVIFEKIPYIGEFND